VDVDTLGLECSGSFRIHPQIFTAGSAAISYTGAISSRAA